MTRVMSSEGGIRFFVGDQESGRLRRRAPCGGESLASLDLHRVDEAQFLLEFLIVALDPPAQFGSFHQGREGCIRRQGREPVFGRRAFVLRPFEEQPLSA